jgi:hypothetical protein
METFSFPRLYYKVGFSRCLIFNFFLLVVPDELFFVTHFFFYFLFRSTVVRLMGGTANVHLSFADYPVLRFQLFCGCSPCMDAWPMDACMDT